MNLADHLSERIAYRKQRSHRIEALADGVFAIVMTLLVLDIRIPIKEINTENGIWFSLLNIWPQLLTYFLSFTLAGQCWSIFTNQFNYIQTSDRTQNINSAFISNVRFLTPVFHIFF